VAFVAGAWASLLAWLQSTFALVRAVWGSWPGRLARWALGTVVLSTIVLNALVVPYCNARVLPRVEAAASAATGRVVSLEGIRWVSPPGVVGLGPVASVNGIYIGPGLVEKSEALAPQAAVSLAPLQSLLQRKLVLNLELNRPDLVVRQAQNYSWFGYPLDTLPSARNFLPGSGPAAAPAAPAPAAPGSGGWAAVREVAVADARIHAYVVGDPLPRRFADVHAALRLGRGYDTLDLDLRGAAHARDPAGMACTMPCNPSARHLRDLTPGGEIAPLNTHPLTRAGPSALSLRKMAVRQAEKAAARGTEMAPCLPPLPQPAAPPPPGCAPLAAERFAPRAAESVDAGAADGGRVRVRIAASEMAADVPWPKCTVTVDGDGLHAALIDRMLEIPMDVYGGTLTGSLEIGLTDTAAWTVFPNFNGRIQVADAAFHFWDSPDDFARAHMTLLFERDRMYVHSARAMFGALDLTAGGDIGLNPDCGQYSIQAKVDAVDVNALRATFGGRPMPYPVAGALGGSMQCYGPLEHPVFTGSVETRALPPAARALADRTDAFATLQRAVDDGRSADFAYDCVPFRCRSGVGLTDARCDATGAWPRAHAA